MITKTKQWRFVLIIIGLLAVSFSTLSCSQGHDTEYGENIQNQLKDKEHELENIQSQLDDAEERIRYLDDNLRGFEHDYLLRAMTYLDEAIYNCRKNEGTNIDPIIADTIVSPTRSAYIYLQDALDAIHSMGY